MLVVFVAVGVNVVFIVLKPSHRRLRVTTPINMDESTLKVSSEWCESKSPLFSRPWYTLACKVALKRKGGSEWATLAECHYEGSLRPPQGCSYGVMHPVDTAYFEVGRLFGVTTDSGKTWSIWNAEKHLPTFDPDKHGFVEAMIEEDGTGVIHLDPAPEQLYTRGFGKTWHPNK